MPAKSAILNIIFTLFAGLGLLLALLGLGMDILLGTHPGLNLPQLLLIVSGLLGSLTAFYLRRGDARRRVWASIREHWRALFVITALTMIALELVLAAAGFDTYYLPHFPETPFEEAPWRICDELGCRFDQEAMAAACEDGERGGRFCIVNRQGFHDAQDFAVGAGFDERTRILMLGDSFTFGGKADIGKSYVETIEANFPEAIVWNTGIPGAGTQQALRLFQAYAPLLQPQIAVLGFYMNDFEDNIMPIDRWVVVDKAYVQQYRLDDQGNITKLDLPAAYYHAFGAAPPENEIQRIIGAARLGSLALKTVDIARWGSRAVFPPEWLLSGARGEGGALEATRGYLRALRDAAAAQNTALLTLLIPMWEDIAAAGQRYQAAVQLMKELEMPYLNPRPLLDDALDYVRAANTHWNSAGHQKIGRLLSACIEAFQIHGGFSACEHVIMPQSAPTE